MSRFKCFLRLEEIEPRTVPAPVTASVSGSLLLNNSSVSVSGVPVTISGTSAGGITVNATAVSDSVGHYDFDNVLPGTYSLKAGSAPGVVGTTPSQSVTVTTGTDVTKDLTYTGGISADFLSLRSFLNEPNIAALQFGPGGSGTALAASRPDEAPVAVQIANRTVDVNSDTDVLGLASAFTDADIEDSQVTFNITSGGVQYAMKVSLFDTKTPQTVANFYDYIDAGLYQDALFTRNQANFVLQGGGASISSNGQTISPIPTLPPVQNEAGISNIKNTLAMALSGGDINSGTNQFFFNTVSNTSLDASHFAVFGQVDDAASQAILALLAQTPTIDISGTATAAANPSVLLNNLPIQNYSGTAATFPTGATKSNYTVINSITVSKQNEKLTYTASSSNPDLVFAQVQGSKLVLDYAPGETGTSTITVTAKDKFGITTSQSFTVTVGDSENSPPLVSAQIPNQTVLQNSPASTIDLTSKFSDVDTTNGNGDTLTYSVVSSTPGVVVASVSGSQLTITPVTGQSGSSVVTVTATDSFGLSISQSFTVTVKANTAPAVATQIPDQTILMDSAPINIGLANKFSDVDTSNGNGDSLTYTAVSTVPGVATVSVAGSLLTVTPVAGQTGSAAITVTATDSVGASISQTFNVIVTGNTAPTAVAPISDVAAVVNSVPQTVSLAGKFDDVDIPAGDSLTYSADSSDPALVTTSVTGDQLTLTFGAGQSGSATITVTATDLHGLTASQTFEVTVQTGTAPTVAAPIADVTVLQDGPASTVSLAGKFDDADIPIGDALTYSAESSDTSLVTVSVADDQLTLTYAAGQFGDATITVTATDRSGLSVSQDFLVTVQPDTAPTTVAPFDDVTVSTFSPPSVIDIAGKFDDADIPSGDLLTYTAVSTDPGLVSVSVSGDQLTLTYITGQSGTATVTVTATDRSGSTVDQSFLVTVEPSTAPTVAAAIADVTVLQDSPAGTVSLAGKFDDADIPLGDSLTYSASSSVPGRVAVSVTGDQLTLTYGAGQFGPAAIIVTATDSTGLTVDQTFFVTVQESTAPTVAAAIADVTVNQDAPASTVSLAGKFDDVDIPMGDVLTYSAVSSVPGLVAVSTTGNQLTLTYGAGQFGDATITVTATDHSGLTVNQTFNVTVVKNPNTAPFVASQIPDFTFATDSPQYTYSLLTAFDDVDIPSGDSLTYSAVSTDSGIVGASVSGTDLKLDFVTNQAGIIMVIVTATDSHNASVSQHFKVTVL